MIWVPQACENAPSRAAIPFRSTVRCEHQLGLTPRAPFGEPAPLGVAIRFMCTVGCDQRLGWTPRPLSL